MDSNTILCCDFAQTLTILFTMLCVFVIIICSESLPDRLKTLKVEVLEKHRGEIKVCCDSIGHYNKNYYIGSQVVGYQPTMNRVCFPNQYYMYSRLSLNRHLYKTDTSVKRTPRVGPCLCLFPSFDSL